jgi:hypothetical protein
MEIQEALRIGYFRSLVGNVTVPVYSEGSVPENASGNYVIITSFSGDQRFTDKCKVFEVIQTIDIVTESQSPTGYGTANSISNLVENIINPDDRVDVYIDDLGWHIGNTFLVQNTNRWTKDKTRYIYRIIKTYRHLISKLNTNT